MAITQDQGANLIESLMEVTRSQMGLIVQQLEAGAVTDYSLRGKELLEKAIHPNPIPTVTSATFLVDTSTIKWTDDAHPSITGYELGIATKSTDEPTPAGAIIKEGVQTGTVKDGAIGEFAFLRCEYTAKKETAPGVYADDTGELGDWSDAFEIVAP